VTTWGAREGEGIPTPVGTRWRWGSDSRAPTKGGSGRASLMRGCLSCGGDGRRGAVSTVSRVEARACFRGRAVGSGGRRSSGGRWCFIKAPVTKEEVRGVAI
jgi:hypothetical protein